MSTPTQPEGLKPCPFCGESNARVDSAGDMPLGHGQYQNMFVVHCGCGVESTTCNTPAFAIAAWNHRTPDAQSRIASLTRDLDASHDRATEAQAERDAAREERDEALAKVAGLEADAGRLDWLGRQYLAGLSLRLCVDEPHDGEVQITRETDTGWEACHGKTLRAAIDASRAAGGEAV